MVKFDLERVEFSWDGTLAVIVARVDFKRMDKRYQLGTKRIWSKMCGEIRRKDVITRDEGHKYYKPIALKVAEAKEALVEKTRHVKAEKSREERRLACACKSKCHEDFVCQVDAMKEDTGGYKY